jgi:glycosyltransferase involved in cell wall biosynthesis
MTTGTKPLRVSVIIPTYNPRADYLRRVIDALRQQTLLREQWEIVVVDNGSRVPLEAAPARQKDQEPDRSEDSVRISRGQTKSLKDAQSEQAAEIDLSWHPHERVVREESLGLTFARLRGFAEAQGELIVMVDDDNLLAPDYLETAVRIAEERPMLGAFGGKCSPEFEAEPEPWLAARGKGLGLRDRGEVPQLFPEETGGGLRDEEGSQWKGGKVETSKGERIRRRVTEFPNCAPIGAGMVLRREAAAAYAERIEQRTTGPRDNGTITDRKGDSLASGGDNDICLTVIEEGWQVGYLPQLQLTHLIPRQRMTLDYHKRMARDSMKSFILMLDQHGIRPWPAMTKWTLPLRVANDWWRVRPWQGPEQSLRFWGHVGMYEGRAALRA